MTRESNTTATSTIRTSLKLSSIEAGGQEHQKTSILLSWRAPPTSIGAHDADETDRNRDDLHCAMGRAVLRVFTNGKYAYHESICRVS